MERAPVRLLDLPVPSDPLSLYLLLLVHPKGNDHDPHDAQARRPRPVLR
jgi:hypothetical protein